MSKFLVSKHFVKGCLDKLVQANSLKTTKKNYTERALLTVNPTSAARIHSVYTSDDIQKMGCCCSL